MCGALLFALGLACAGGGTGGSGRPDVPIEQDAARLHEARQVAVRVAALAGTVREVGSKLELTFWSEQGALTLVGYQAQERGGRAGRPVDAAELQRQVATRLLSTARQPPGEVVLTLERRASSWRVDPPLVLSGERPQGARGAPGRREAGTPEPGAVVEGMKKLLAPVRVPVGGSAWADVTVRLRDGRVVGWGLQDWRELRGGRDDATRPVSRRVLEETASVLLLHAPATGTRSLQLGLRLVHEPGAAAASGWVEVSSVSAAPSPSGGISSLLLP
ncbi:hypothetical protein SAMN05443572_11482 [Myxococcus fulvus]|uniref:Uncharacterized protein n=1 Tax=Myxococcus fulvus TaxID=33 RepID=A0A511TCS1_MYXFU|nr:hypothetical protein MFU01_62690 [Myxococcus fulvus]SEU39468.1 hypothetical protein SAMN05443572_11482 [Myxococcus fulvus]